MSLRVPGYEVERELGRGGMGVVLLARELATDRRVAIKVALEAGPEQLLRFAREGELLARLDHPGIVRVHAARAADRRPYLVCELVEGARAIVEAAAPLPPDGRARLVRDAARALGHAHARGVVHRDVKPDNLLVDRDGRVRVADFGVALAADLERLTRTNELVGTPAYMAPEQLAGRGAPVTPAADVWALGAVLFRLLTGRPPFDGATLVALMAQVADGRAPRARAVAADVPPALDDVVARALEPDPAARFSDGEALATALDAALGRPPARRAASPWLAGGACLGLLGLGALAALLALRARPQAPPAAPAPSPAPAPAVASPAVPSPVAAPAAPAPAWLDALRAADAASRLRALEALDEELAAGRSPTPEQRAVATRRLRGGFPASPAGGTLDLEVYDALLWSHALLRRLDPAHRPGPEHARVLADVTLIRPLSDGRGLAVRGLELSRLLPDLLEAPLLHADGCSVTPAAADAAVIRSGLAVARARLTRGPTEDEDPEGAWLLLAQLHAAWLAARAADAPALRLELAALAEEAEPRLAANRGLVSRILSLAARHAPPARARALLEVADAHGANVAEDHLLRALAWAAVSRAEGPATPSGEQASTAAVLLGVSAVEAILKEQPPSLARLERAGAAIEQLVGPELGLPFLERLLERAPQVALPGVAVRRVLALARTDADEGHLAAALGELAPRLEAWARLPRDRPWLDEGAALVRRLAGRSGLAAATREQLAAWWARRRVGLLPE